MLTPAIGVGNYPRVSTILKEMILFDQDAFWLQPKYLRRGRLVDAAATIVATGGTVDPEWLNGHSGERDDDRVEHVEVLPYLDGVRQFLSEQHFVVKATQVEVVHEGLEYVGHLDWLACGQGKDWLIDVKCGAPPAQWIKPSMVTWMEGGAGHRDNPLWVSYRRQTALYAMALGTPHIKRAGLHLFDGTYQFVPHDDRSDIAASTAMIHAYYDRIRFKRR